MSRGRPLHRGLLRLGRPLAVAMVCAASLSCAAGPDYRRDAEPPDLQPVWEAEWRSDWRRAFALASELGWEARRSVAGERARQNVGLQLGLRGQLMAEVLRWQEHAPDDPDLAYLEARLLQNPERQERRFQQLARKWPGHAWIQLGNAAVLLQGDRSWKASAEFLSDAPDWPEARSFRRSVEARLAAKRRHPEAALEGLYEAAFSEGDRVALGTYLEVANDYGFSRERDLAAAEIQLLQLATDSAPEQRIDAAVTRAVAESLVDDDLDLDEVLARLDGFSERAGVAGGWQDQERYSVGPFGSLARPESASGGPAAEWQALGRTLLVGEAWFHGVEFLLLQDVLAWELPWPGEDLPLEILLSPRSLSSHGNGASGATLFRGFFLREDLVARRAEQLYRAARAVGTPSEPWQIPVRRERDSLLPEDFDLPLRLRSQVLAEHGLSLESVGRLELQTLALHEAGHLPEVLPWLPDGPPLSVLPKAIGSWLRTGDVMTWLELRAEARALAASPEPHWVLAEIVQFGREGDGRYHHAYRELLEGLLELAERADLPPYPRWHELSKEQIRGLAREWCTEVGDIALLPEAGLRGLLEALEAHTLRVGLGPQ